MHYTIGILAFLSASACNVDNLFQQRGDANVGAPEEATIFSDENGVLTAQIHAGKGQYMTGSAEEGLDGATVTFYSDSLAIDTNVTLQRGDSLIQGSDAAALGVNGSSASNTLVLSSSAQQNPVNPFAIEIDANDASLYLAGRLVVVYKVWDYAQNKLRFGYIRNSELRIEKGRVYFSARFFGAYEVAYVDAEPATTEITTDKPIISSTTKNESTPPAPVGISGLPTSPSNANSLSITVSGTAIIEYKYAVSQSSSCGSYSNWLELDDVLTYGPANDGTYRLCIIGRNAAGLPQESPTEATFQIDRTAPIIGISGTYHLNQTTTLDASISGGATSVSWVETSGSANISFGTPNQSMTAISASSDGNYIIRVTATDAAGNSSSSTFDVEWDTSPPPPLDAFSAVSGDIPGSMQLILDFPASTTDYDRVQIFRSASNPSAVTSPPSCGAGSQVFESYSEFSDTTFHEDAEVDSEYASYTACIYDKAGNETSINTVTDALFKNIPAVLGQYDAADIDGDGTINSGSVVATTATTWVDSSGNGRNLALAGFNETVASGWQGTGTTADPYRLKFDGVDDIGVYGTADLAWKSLTVWFKYSSSPAYSSSAYIVALSTNYRCALASSAMTCLHSGADFLGTGVSKDEWHFLTVSYSGGSANYYLDGHLFDSQTAGSPPLSSLSVGARNLSPPTDLLDGEIAQVVVYEDALDSHDVLYYYNQTRSRFEGEVSDLQIDRITGVAQPESSPAPLAMYGRNVQNLTEVKVDGTALGSTNSIFDYQYSGIPALLTQGDYDLTLSTSDGGVSTYTGLIESNPVSFSVAYFTPRNVDSLGAKGSSHTERTWMSLRGGRTGNLYGGQWAGNGSAGDEYRADLDGSDDYISFGMFNGVSYSVWFRPDNVTGGYVISLKNNANNVVYAGLQYGQVQFRHSTNGTVKTAGSVGAGTWHHIVLTHNGTDAVYYLDGAQVASETVAQISGPFFFTVGMFVNGSSTPFDGSIGDVHVYNYGLSAWEVTSLYSIGSARYP